MQQEELNKKIVRDMLESLWNENNLAALDPHPGVLDLKKIFPAVRAALPDFRGRIEQQFAAEDRVATHAWLSGTHKGVLFGIPPSGKFVEFQSVSIARLVDGIIVQYNSEVGWLGVLMQLGILPLK